MPEILIKGSDGKWYFMRDGKLVLKDAAVATSVVASSDLPKGVSKEEYLKISSNKLKVESPLKQDTKTIPVANVASASGGAPKVANVVAQSHENHPLVKELEEIIDGVMGNEELRMKNEEWVKDGILSKRFRTIVSARLRDVRDQSETRAMLLRDAKVGGMGMSMEYVTRSMEQIEKAFREFQEKWKGFETKRREEWRAKQSAEVKREEEEGKKNEEHELQERYQKLTGHAPSPQSSPTRGEEGIRSPSPVPGRGQGEGKKSQPTIPKQTVVLSAKPNVLPTVLFEKPSKPKAEPVLPPVVQKKVLAPAPSVPLPSKPPGKVTDIKPAPKLIGPLEELKSLTLVDFRRLSTSAEEASAKVIAKIAFLKQESIMRGISASDAWRSSPLNQLYLQVLNEALIGGVSPETVLTRNQGGVSVLTLNEFHAIMELNRKLRF